MKEDCCILCGRAYPAGLHVMGCLICFPCEKRLLGPRVPASGRRALTLLYGAGSRPVPGKNNVLPFFREQNRAVIR